MKEKYVHSDRYDGPDRRNAAEPWHIKREVTWGHLMSTITLLGMLIMGFYDVKSDIETNAHKIEANKAEITHTQELNEVQNEQFKDAVKEVKEQYKNIDNKLDRLIQERHDH